MFVIMVYFVRQLSDIFVGQLVYYYMRKEISQEEIRWMWEVWLSNSQIARALGCHKQTVGDRLKKMWLSAHYNKDGFNLELDIAVDNTLWLHKYTQSNYLSLSFLHWEHTPSYHVM